MSEQLTLIEEAFGLTVVEGENLQLTLDGGNGPAGPAGPSGSGSITTSSTTNLTGYIFGNGTIIAGATDAASAATPSTLVVRTAGGAASFTGITNNGALTLSTGTTFTYGAGIAAAHRTALGLGSLATQSGTFSGTSSGTNTGDQDLSGLLLSTITVSNLFDPDSNPITLSLIEQAALVNGRRAWVTADLSGSLEWDTGVWTLGTNEGYEATISSPSDAPWKLTGWTVLTGSGAPSFAIDPTALLPSDNSGTMALATDQQGRVAPPDMTGLGVGVASAMAIGADTNGGFLTAGTGGRLPIARGGTGSTTAATARTALGSTAIGDELFTAANPGAARTTLGIQTKTGNSTGLAAVGTADIAGLTGYNLDADTWYKLELQYLWTSASSNFQINFVTTGTFLRGGTTPALGQANSSVAALSAVVFVNDTSFQLRGSVGENRTNVPAQGYAYFKTGTAGTGKLQLQLLAGTTLSTITSSCAVLTKQN